MQTAYRTTVVDVVPPGVVVEYVVAGVVVTTVAGAGAGSRRSTVLVLTLQAPSSPTAIRAKSTRIIGRPPVVLDPPQRGVPSPVASYPIGSAALWSAWSTHFRVAD
jgi:hypothetical protein